MSLFSRDDFQHTIKGYCKRCGFEIYEIDDSHATLVFKMPSGQDQILYIRPFGSTLEFSVPSALKVDRLEDLPHELSTKLLERSSSQKIGFWCIEEFGGQYAYSYMHNAEMKLITPEYFGQIVVALVQECEQFELALWQFTRH